VPRASSAAIFERPKVALLMHVDADAARAAIAALIGAYSIPLAQSA
jgi:hypothetical protein